MNRSMPLDLIMLPFAGAGKHAYKILKAQAPINFNCISTVLPGRGTRCEEKLLTNLHDMVEDIFDQIKNRLHQPYAIYGHSMGAMLGYLLTRKIINAKNISQPRFLFVSARGGPSWKYAKSGIHNFSREKFAQAISEYGWAHDQVALDPKIFNLFSPPLRADLEAVDNYDHKELDPFSIPIMIAIGQEDKITLEQALCWQRATTEPIELIQFPGKHFFIFEHASKIMTLMANR